MAIIFSIGIVDILPHTFPFRVTPVLIGAAFAMLKDSKKLFVLVWILWEIAFHVSRINYLYFVLSWNNPFAVFSFFYASISVSVILVLLAKDKVSKFTSVKHGEVHS